MLIPFADALYEVDQAELLIGLCEALGVELEGLADALRCEARALLASLVDEDTTPAWCEPMPFDGDAADAREFNRLGRYPL